MLGVSALDPQQPEPVEPTPESPDAAAPASGAPQPEPGASAPPGPESKAAPSPDAAPDPTAAPGPHAAPGANAAPGASASSGPKAAPGPKAPPKAKTKKPKPPGLFEQLRKTGLAAADLAKAHVDLAKEEAGEIGREGGKLAGLMAAAVGLVLLAAILLIIGTTVFLGEWLFGSAGWGVVHGTLAFLTFAVALVLLGLGVSPVRIARALLVGIVVGVVTAVVLGLGLLNQLYASIGTSLALNFEPGVRPLIVGMVLGAIVGLVIEILAAARAATPNWFLAIGGGIVLGVIAGAFTSITFGPQVGAALGVTIAYLTWAGLMALDVYRTGIDIEALKTRFTPTQTIETSKETLEWLQKRMPRGNGS